MFLRTFDLLGVPALVLLTGTLGTSPAATPSAGACGCTFCTGRRSVRLNGLAHEKNPCARVCVAFEARLVPEPVFACVPPCACGAQVRSVFNEPELLGHMPPELRIAVAHEIHGPLVRAVAAAAGAFTRACALLRLP